jgi:hypothetical protein
MKIAQKGIIEFSLGISPLLIYGCNIRLFLIFGSENFRKEVMLHTLWKLKDWLKIRK